MASIQGLRHLERPADNRGRYKHVPGRKPFFVAVAAFIALAAAALIATLGQGGTTYAQLAVDPGQARPPRS